MKHFTYLLSFLLSIQAMAQLHGDIDGPCKPIDKMMQHYQSLAKSSETTDYNDYDVHYYVLDLNIDVDTEIVTGMVEVHFRSEADSLESILLDLDSGMTVDSISLNAANFNHFSDLLSLTLDGSYDVGETAVVGIYYHGHPTEVGFKGFDFSNQFNNVARSPMISTLSEPYGARSWWPCKDVPTDKADSVRVTVTTDADLDVVSNGILQSETMNTDGTTTTVWKHNYPVTTYLVSLAITDYTYWTETYHFADGDSMPLEYWMYPASATNEMMERWNRTEVMLDVFNDLYGKYPYSNEKYGMAQFEWGGAMEHQTCSSMGSYGENTIAHELAHQWWGNLVTCSDFHHIWINEGFATYSEALYWGAVNGEAAYHAHMADKMNDVNSSVYRYDASSVSAIFSWYMVYQKGAWVLHMLRHVLGDEVFFASLTAFREEFQFSHASTEDFQGVVEDVSSRDMEWFFDQWIYGIGKPHYQWWWSAQPQDDGTARIFVNVEQTQSTSMPTYKMPIDLTFSDGFNDTTVVVWDSLRTQEFSFSLDFQPTELRFDEEAWIFSRASQVATTDAAFGPGSFKLHSAYPNPFNGEVRIPYTTGSDFSGKLTIYDLRGSEVFSHALHHTAPAEYEVVWNGRDQKGLNLESGVYIALVTSLEQGSFSQKISLLK